MAGKEKKPVSPITPGRAQQIATNAMAAESRTAGIGTKNQDNDFKFIKAVISGDDPNYRNQQRGGRGGYALPTRLDDLTNIYNPSSKAIKLAQTGGLDNLSDDAIRTLLTSGNLSKPKKFESTGIPAWDAAYATMNNPSNAEKAVKYSKAHNEWESFDVKYQRLAFTNAQQELGDTSIVWSDAMSKNPEIALAAASAFNNGTLRKQQLKVINNAMEVLQTLSNISLASSDEARAKIFARLSATQQKTLIEVSNALFEDIAIEEEKREAQQKADKKAFEETKGTLPEKLGARVESVENLLGAGFGGIWDGLIWLSDNAQHVYRSRFVQLEDDPLSLFNPLYMLDDSFSKAWEDTELGSLAKEDYNKLTTKYGKETVDVVRDAMQAMGSEDGWVNLLDKYKDNQAALDIIDEIILEDERGAKITELLGEVNNTTRDDLGNLVANKILPDSWQGNNLWDLLDVSTNAAALWFGDPTLIAGKLSKSYKIFKYGLIKNSGPGSLEKVMSRKPVQRLFNSMLDDLRTYDNIVDTTEKGFYFSDVIKVKYGKYVTRDFMDDLITYDRKYGNVYKDNVSLTMGYLREADSLDQLLLGRPVRSGSVLMPRMTATRSVLIDRYISTKKILNFDGSERDFIRSLTPTEISSLEKLLTPQEWPSFVSGLRADELLDGMIDDVVRTKIASHYGIDPESIITKGSTGLPKGGKYTEGIIKYGGPTKRLPIGINTSRQAWYLRTDRWMRNFERMPMGGRVNIADASDADLIYAWARTTFSKHFANNLVEHWRFMPEGQRRIFLGGMFKTIAEARGLYAITPEVSAIVDEAITSSLKAGEQYAVTMARPLAMLQDVDILASGSARAMRDVLPNLDRAAQQRISALGFRMKQVIEQRKLLAQEVKAIAYDAGATAKRTKKETSVLEDLAEIRKTNATNASKLKSQFEETEKELRKILKKLDDEVEASSGVAKLANREISSNVRESLKSIDRKIRGIETRLGKATETDAIKLEQQLNALKGARERLAKSSTAAYFELQKYKGIREFLKNEGADFAYYNPAEINGRQHALHADQLSSYITLPNYEVLQAYSVKVGILNKILGWSHKDFAKKGTDYWSSLNLVGPRYVQRAAIEDALGYAMTGGRVRDIVVGHRMTRTVREVRGKSLGIMGDRLSRLTSKLVSKESTTAFEAIEPGVTKVGKSLKGKPAGASYDFVQSILNDFIEATPQGKSLVQAGFSRYEPVDELKAIFDARSDAVLQYLRETGKITFTTRKEMIHSFGEYYDTGTIGDVLQLPHSKLVQDYNEAYFKLFHNLDPDDTVRLYRSVGSTGAEGTEQVGYATFDPRMALSFSRSNPNRQMVRFDVKVKDLHQPVNGSGFGDEFSMGVTQSTPVLNKKVYSLKETEELIKRVPANRNYFYYYGKGNEFISVGQRNAVEFRFTFPKAEFKRIDLNDTLTEAKRQEIRDAVDHLKGIRTPENPEGYLLIKADGDQRIIQLNPKAFAGSYHQSALDAIKTIQDNLGIQLMKPIPGRTFYEWEQGLFKIDEYRAESNLLDEAQDLTVSPAQDKMRLSGLFVKEQLTKDEILQADELAKLGDTSGLQRLAIKGLARRKLKMVLGRELKGIEEKALVSWIGQDNGFQLLDEVAEVPDDFIKGAVGGSRYRPDIAQTKKVQYGDWTNIEATDSNFHLLWYRKIHSILHRDGAVGQITFNALRSSDTIAQAKAKALPKIVQAIKDGKLDMKRYSIFNEPNMTINEFASRYFDDSAWYFSSARGEAVNKKLVQMITRRNPETGAYFGRLYLKNEAGELVDRIYIDDLRTGFTSADRPEFVLGRKEVVQGMTEYHTPGTLERAWTWMADSLARVSREPIYFARYVDEYKALQPLKQRYLASGMDDAAAEAMLVKLASRRAEEVSIAFMDNPAVRSIAAGNLRNLARYYRATEDFYRRMVRLAKYNPEGFQKLNLLYNSFDHSGFIHTDENGNQYFVYPGTGVLNDTVARVINRFTGGNIQIGNPFAFGGLTTMLTPSADPESWKPTFASPFASVPLKIMTSFGPFAELEKYLLGTRGAKPSGDLLAVTKEVVESTFPSHFARAWNALTGDERNSQYASAVRGAIQILAYNGDLDDDKLATVEAEAEAMTKLKNVSAGILITRFFLGFVLPASPQTMEKDNLTTEARKLGLKSLRPAFTQLISKYEGDLDKAIAVWYKLNPRLMPFTIAGSQGTLQAYPSLTNKAAEWIKEHGSFIKRHPEAAVFLMPRGGEFSFDAYGYAVANKMIEGKTAKEMFLQVITAKDYYVFMQNKENYQKEYDATASPFQRAQYEQMWNAYRDQMYANNPYLKTRVGSFLSKSNDGLKDRVLQDIRASLDEIYAPNATVPRSKSTDRIKSMLATYDEGMTEINKFSGRSDFYATGERKRLKNRLRVILQDIAGKDQNALTLYRTILDGKIN